MNSDSQRDRLQVKFTCSKHPEVDLTFSTKLSRIGADSAMSINPEICIHPCRVCEREHQSIIDAVNKLMSLSNNHQIRN
mgnify:CR=1 FL=1|tara:strand:- start:1386 stop:1622 length:237 start_codon:yes stop_codon:yes gene_type:complete